MMKEGLVGFGFIIVLLILVGLTIAGLSLTGWLTAIKSGYVVMFG